MEDCRHIYVDGKYQKYGETILKYAVEFKTRDGTLYNFTASGNLADIVQGMQGIPVLVAGTFEYFTAKKM